MREVTTSYCTVLVADDSSDTLEMIGVGLRMSGYQVQFAHDGAEAFRFLDDNCCDAVVSDLTMPNMGGIELLHAIRARSELEHIPVILMSAAHGELEQVASETNGVLQKPIDFSKLLRLLSRLRGRTVDERRGRQRARN